MIHTLEADSSDCNSSHRYRCRDPNSANTDCHHATAAAVAAVLEAATGFDSAEVEVAVAEQMSTAAAGGMACTTPWLDFQTQ